jgi:hypothetical protein
MAWIPDVSRLFQKKKRDFLTDSERQDVEDDLKLGIKKQIEIARELNVDVEVVYAAEKRMQRRIERQERDQVAKAVEKKASAVDQWIAEEEQKEKLREYFSRGNSEPEDQGIAGQIKAVTELLNSPIVTGLIAAKLNPGAPVPQQLPAPTMTPEQQAAAQKEQQILANIEYMKKIPRKVLNVKALSLYMTAIPAEQIPIIKATYTDRADVVRLVEGVGIDLKDKEIDQIYQAVQDLEIEPTQGA